MSETLINPNQIRDGIGGKIKILNVVQNGSLYRSDGTKFTNFSSSNYLTVGGVVQNGIFSQTQNVLNFGDFFSTANSWEVNGSFKLNAKTDAQQIFYGNTSKCIGLEYAYNDGENQCLFCGIYTDSTTQINLKSPDYSITFNTKYYFRIQFTGTEYKLYINTDGQTYDNTTLVDTIISNTTYNEANTYLIGAKNWGGNFPVDGQIDLADWNIKKNGQYWWKGVETL